MLQLNPGFNRPITTAKRSYKLVLPIERVVEFTENLSTSPYNHRKIDWIHYKVKAGDTLASIATKFKTTPKEIKKFNHLAKNAVRHNNNLLIPKNVTASSKNIAALPKAVATSSQPIILQKNKYTLQPGDTIYMARNNDTLDSIAKKFKISADAIKIANRLKSNNINVGKQLVLPTHRNDFPQINQQASTKQLSPGDTIYMIRKGDTIDKIARRFKTTPSSIRLANLINDGDLVAGTKIIIPTHLHA